MEVVCNTRYRFVFLLASILSFLPYLFNLLFSFIFFYGSAFCAQCLFVNDLDLRCVQFIQRVECDRCSDLYISLCRFYARQQCLQRSDQ
jgi:hypothetical protein